MSKIYRTLKPVRCRDCIHRKKCKFVRIDKNKMKPCEGFSLDLNRASNVNKEKAKIFKSPPIG